MADISKIRAQLSLAEANAPSGFAIAFHIRLTAPDFLFQTYPRDWINTYSERGYVMSDPIVRWGFTQDGAMRWSELASLDDQDILGQSRAYGMNYGVAISTETGTSRSVAGFARPDREYTDAEIEALTACVVELHALTETSNGMDEDTRAALHRLSVEMTHPGSDGGAHLN